MFYIAMIIVHIIARLILADNIKNYNFSPLICVALTLRLFTGAFANFQAHSSVISEHDNITLPLQT